MGLLLQPRFFREIFMIIFFSDLDNTMIFSYRHEIGKDKRCVEIYQGREISFVTEKTYGLLKKLKEKALFVPVTTRTVEQYRRIDLGVGTLPYALVCNGGVLLANGQEDESWYLESRRMVEDCQDELRTAARILEEDENRSLEVRDIRDLFLFTKSKCPEESAQRLKKRLDMSRMEVFCNGVKVYALPKKLNKGMAIKRLAGRAGAGKIIAAGDSAFDLPMLAAADIGIAPGELAKAYRLKDHVVRINPAAVFSDEILEFLMGVTG